MEPTQDSASNELSTEITQSIQQLTGLFGSFKAEWLNERVFQLFNIPNYYAELLGNRPTVLVGGRGTGKTTVLRGLSYEGQYALNNEDIDAFRALEAIGIYYKVDPNRVTALDGPEIDNWRPLFGHYFNLVVCVELAHFLLWYSDQAGKVIDLSLESYELLCLSLSIPTVSSLSELSSSLLREQVRFEAYVNNIGEDTPGPALSMHGAPVALFVSAIRALPGFEHKRVDIIIDEYENFYDYQQQVINTLIKHSGTGISYKIGVKELGWRIRTTLNENEQLISPSDYDRLDVTEALSGDAFKRFAEDVCNSRLARLQRESTSQWSLPGLFPGLTEDQEARRLGSDDVTGPFRAALSTANRDVFDDLGASRQLVVARWAERETTEPNDLLADLISNEAKWKIRFNNYKHAYLYTLKRRKRGIRKYYAGWDVMIQLAGGNIRYLLELVEEDLVAHVKAGGKLGEPVSPEQQTKSAARVASKNLFELEGLAINGTKITKLVLSLGRVFQLMAQQPEEHTPEVNEFRVRDDPGGIDAEGDADKLLDSAVMHLALVRTPGNKLASTQTREYDYTLHPLFCALFVYSYRRKRKMVISAGDLLGLVIDPPKYIGQVLRASGRVIDDDLPEQLTLFREFYR